MSPAFKKATKKRRKLRLAIAGISGSGKTYTALELACRLAEEDGGRVALVDTEHGSAADYAALFDFDTVPMPPPYRPDRLVKAAQLAAEEGYPVLVVDGLSPFWDGAGGVLEIVDKANTNKFSGWKEGTPAQNAMVNALLAYPGHVVVTMRSKADYVVSASGAPKKVGMAPVQRAGIEYEFALMLSLDDQHVATVTKSRVVESDERFGDLVLGAEITRPDGDLAEQMLAWLADGTSDEDEKAAAEQREAQRARAAAAHQQTLDENAGAQGAASGSAAPAAAVGAAAPGQAAAAPAAAAALPPHLAKQPGEKVPERDQRIAYRVLVRGEKAGAVAADEHVSSAVVRGARKKHEEAHARGEHWWGGTEPAGPTTAPPPSAPSSPSPASTPAPAAPETPAPAPAAAAGPETRAEAPPAATAPPAAPGVDVDAMWGAAAAAVPGWDDALSERYALVLGELAATGRAPASGSWDGAFENRARRDYDKAPGDLDRQQVLTLLEMLESTLHSIKAAT